MKTVMAGNTPIVVQATEFKNVKYIDVRRFYSTAEGNKPTKKGVYLPVTNAREIAQAILQELDGLNKPESLLPNPCYVFLSQRMFDLVQKGEAPTKLRIDGTHVFETREQAREARKEQREAYKRTCCVLTFAKLDQRSVTLEGETYAFRGFSLKPLFAK